MLSSVLFTKPAFERLHDLEGRGGGGKLPSRGTSTPERSDGRGKTCILQRRGTNVTNPRVCCLQEECYVRWKCIDTVIEMVKPQE